MEEALELAEYLPASFKTTSEQDYVRFLWDAFESNYTSEKFEFASLAYHLLYMSFVSFSIWQIRLAREQDFKHALVGFQPEAENNLLAAVSPYKFYDKLKESQIFRFLKIIGCDNAQVGEFSKFVKRRNKIAHPSGTVFFNDQNALDDEIVEIMKEVTNIQGHMRPLILTIYDAFLNESADSETREYSIAADEVTTGLVHRYYLSLKDIRICLGTDLVKYASHPHEQGIKELHEALGQLNPMEE